MRKNVQITSVFLWGDTMGKSSQKKGRAGELELMRLLQAHGIPAQPGQAVSFGATPDIVGVNGIHCEVKRVQNLNLCAALRQAAEDSAYFEDGLPCIFHRRNREGWVCSMLLSDWLALYKAAKPEEIREKGVSK